MSYGLRLVSGSMSSSASSARSDGVGSGPRPHGRGALRSYRAWTRGTPSSRDALVVVGHLPVPHAALAAVHARAAEFLLGDVLPDRGAHEAGPASAIEPRPRTIGTKSARPGMYAVPAAHGPISAATWGITPLMITSSRNRCPEPANIAPAASCTRAPAESSSHTNGMRLVSASSRRRVDLDLAGHPHRAGHHGEVVRAHRHEAPVDLAVARDHPVRGGLHPVHRALGEVWAPVDADLDDVPASISSAMRSRAVSLPRSCCLAIFSSPPPSIAFARRASRSSTSGRSSDVRVSPPGGVEAGDGFGRAGPPRAPPRRPRRAWSAREWARCRSR